MSLDALKSLLVPSLFPSDEDGNPNNYEIDFYVGEDNTLRITLESK